MMYWSPCTNMILRFSWQVLASMLSEQEAEHFTQNDKSGK